MFNGIRSRLIISHTLVIWVALIIAFVTLLVVMRPLQIRAIQARLGVELTNTQPTILQLVRQQRNEQRPLSDLPIDALPLNPQDRLLILNQTQTVIFDSNSTLEAQTFAIQPKAQQNRAIGITDGVNGRRLVYVAVPLSSNAPDRLWVVLASQLPRTLMFLLGQTGARFIIIGFLIAAAIAFLIALILSLLITRSVSDPLQGIASAAEAVANGDYNQQVPVMGPLEVKQMARSFNGMTARVKAHNKAMQDFVANASHELKTPLTSIQGFAQALQDGATNDEDSRNQAANIIFNEATRMRHLIEDFLDLARIDAGHIVIGKQPIMLAALIDTTLDRLNAQIEAKKIVIDKAYENLPDVVGDGDRLIQVFMNLIENAIKHSPERGTVIIRGSADTSTSLNGTVASSTYVHHKLLARVSIADEGPGIRSEDLSRIFERLYQVDKSRKRGHGMGLGLAIAHDIIQAHGGHIRAQSTLGQSTQFTVWLPTKEADVSTLVTRRTVLRGKAG